MANKESTSSNAGSGPVRSCCGGNHGNNPGEAGQMSGGYEPAQGGHSRVPGGVTRREFLQVTGTSALGAVVLPGRIVENPFMPICRTQVNISYACDDRLLARKMPGFHWITVYGDYLKESEYALKKIGIEQENLV